MRRGEIAQKPIWISKFTPNLFMLYKEWGKSKYYRGKLSEWLDINPSTDISFLNPKDTVSFIPMEAVEENGAGITIQNTIFENVAQGYTRFSENDLIWAKITPCMQNGKSGVARNLNFGIGFGSTEFHVLRSKNDEVNIDFIKHLLTLDVVLTAAQGTFSGTAGQQRVPDQFLLDLPLPLPPVKEQNNLISAIETARAKRQSMLAEADGLLQGIDSFVLDELGLKLPKEVKNIFAIKLNKAKVGRIDVENFLDEKRNKSTLKGFYPNKRLADISKIIMGQAPEGKEYNDEGNGLPLVAGAADLGEIYPNPQKWTTSFPKKSQPNDIILCIRATIGNLNWSDKEYCLGRGVAGIRPNKSLIDENYLYEALWLRRHYLLSRGTGSTFKQITSEEIENCPIPLPPLDIQKKLAKEILNRRAQARQLREEAERLWQGAKEKFEKALLG